MKKLLFCLVFLPLLVFSRVSAQDFNYQRAYQDYLYNYSIYLSAHDNYTLRRANFLEYKTLLSEDEAEKATLAMLQARDKTLETLLTAIRMKIKETEGIPDAQKASLYSRLDPEVKFYQDHEVKLTSALTLPDLAGDSDVAKDRFSSSTEPLIYTALVEVSIGSLNNERGLIEDSITDLKTKVAEIKTAGDKNISFIDKHFVDLENMLSRSQYKETEARTNIALMEKSVRNRIDFYNDAITSVQGSYVFLKEVVTKLKEIIRLIKIN
jgi:hypothetical protein